jgi:DNA-binding transcriptional ArsR family regulator
LVALLAAPESRRAIGSAWPLYLALVLEWGGTVTGTRDEIAGRMGEDGRNMGNWISALERAGIVTVERNGRRMRVRLGAGHMEAATAPETVTVVRDMPNPARDDGRRDVLDLMDRARALGGEAEVRIVVKAR